VIGVSCQFGKFGRGNSIRQFQHQGLDKTTVFRLPWASTCQVKIEKY
jgi:hypothetical protein